MPGNSNDCKAWEMSGPKNSVGNTTVPARKEAHTTSHREVRGRVEHAFARMKTRKILRDCR